MSEDGLVLGGRYTLGRMLGHGGMAEVYLAEDSRLHRTVAVKVLRSDLARDATFQERFRREAQSAAGLNHPSIVAVYDTGEEHRTSVTGAEMSIPYIVMEYVHGTTLREHIDPEHPLDPAKAGEIMAALLSALEYSHRAGIVHRDIKPGNVMITDAGDVKVMDFGIARAVADAASAMTATQAVMGTAQYLSPEQARGQLVDARSDIYSAACVMHEMLTGRPPFTGDTPVSIAYQHVREDPAAPSAYNPAITPAMDAVILTGLAKDREERYPSAVAFSRDIAAVVAGHEPRLVDGAVPVGADAASTTVLGAVDDATEAIPVTGPTTVVPALAGAAATRTAGSPSSPDAAFLPRSADEVEEPESRRPVVLIVLVVLAALALVAALLWWLLPRGSDEPTTVPVPTLVGETEESAGTLLTEAGLTPAFEQETSADVEQGTVISSDPEAGTSVDVGVTVTVVVSSGPGEVSVPDLRGLTRDQIEDRLDQVGLVGSYQGTEDARGIEEGVYSRSDPQSGTTAAEGQEVQYWVGTGQWTVPNVENLSLERATEALQAEGFEVGETTTAESTEYDPDTVLTQTPASGSTQPIGTSIDLVVAAEPGPTTVPNVEGNTLEEARTRLTEAGFGNEPREEASDSVEAGRVIRTEPGANAEAERNSTIVIVVSTGPEPTPDPTPDPTTDPAPDPTTDPATPSEDPSSSPPADPGPGDGTPTDEEDEG